MGSLMMIDSEAEICLILKSVMDLSMAMPLQLSLLECLATDKAVNVMGSDVERITTPCLQVLCAMKKRTVDDNIDFFVTKMSEAFQKTVKDIGLEDYFISLEQKA